jgi:hypothetical protein
MLPLLLHSLECWTTNKVQKPRNPECYTQPSDPLEIKQNFNDSGKANVSECSVCIACNEERNDTDFYSGFI